MPTWVAIEAETLEQFEKVMKAELAAEHDAEVLADDPELPAIEEELEGLAAKITDASEADEAARPDWVQTAALGTVDTLEWLVGDGGNPPAGLGERGGVVARAVAQRRQKTAVESAEEFVIGGLAGVIEGLLFAITFGLLDLDDAEPEVA